jgi:hypothetical protein
MAGKSLNDDLVRPPIELGTQYMHLSDQMMQIEDDELLKELTMGLKVADSVPPNRRYSIYQSFN